MKIMDLAKNMEFQKKLTIPPKKTIQIHKNYYYFTLLTDHEYLLLIVFTTSSIFLASEVPS